LGQLGLNLARGKSHPAAIEYLVWLGGFASAAAILILLGRIALRLLKQAEIDAAASAAAERDNANVIREGGVCVVSVEK
jgi:hypothetical protein